MIIITCHGRETDGRFFCALLDRLVSNLESMDKDFLVVKHYIFGEKKPEIELYRKGKLVEEYGSGICIKIGPLRYIYEIFLNSLIIFKNKKTITNYIGIDPLNSFAGYICKKAIKFENIYYTADYSKNKFANNLLNAIYHKIDKICVLNSDFVWNISSRIQDIRREMGLEESKNIFLPNVPGLVESQKIRKKEKYTLITSGNLRGQLDNIGIINAVHNLKNKFPKIKFLIVGDGPKRQELELYIQKKGLENHIFLTGRLEFKKYLELLSTCGVGIALYNGTLEFNYFGDSTKCREYMYFGLPILTTDFHSTAREIKNTNSGIVVNSDEKNPDYEGYITRIFNEYDTYSMNSLKNSETNNKLYIETLKKLG